MTSQNIPKHCLYDIHTFNIFQPGTLNPWPCSVWCVFLDSVKDPKSWNTSVKSLMEMEFAGLKFHLTDSESQRLRSAKSELTSDNFDNQWARTSWADTLQDGKRFQLHNFLALSKSKRVQEANKHWNVKIYCKLWRNQNCVHPSSDGQHLNMKANNLLLMVAFSQGNPNNGLAGGQRWTIASKIMFLSCPSVCWSVQLFYLHYSFLIGHVTNPCGKFGEGMTSVSAFHLPMLSLVCSEQFFDWLFVWNRLLLVAAPFSLPLSLFLSQKKGENTLPFAPAAAFATQSTGVRLNWQEQWISSLEGT